MDTIIVKYLAQNKRLVVPEFGAFIKKDTGEVVFVEFLKKDDQVLITLLQNEYSLAEAEARGMIEDFILTVKRTVGETGRYVIERLGTMRTDANGLYELLFNPAAAKSAVEKPRTETSAHARTEEPEMIIVHAGEREESEPTDNAAFGANESEDAAVFGTNKTEEAFVIEPKGEDKTPETMQPQTQEPAKEVTLEYREVPVQENLKPRTLNDIYTSPASATVQEPPTPQRPATTTPPREAAAERPAMEPERRNDAQAKARSQAAKPVNYTKKKTDGIMIIAIIAALAAIISMIYGLFVNSDPTINIQPTASPDIENVVPAADGGEAVAQP